MIFSKIAKAQAVLACFELIIDEQSDKFYVEAYQNGRESGFAIISFEDNRKVALSENRNKEQQYLSNFFSKPVLSDDIVVYTGKVNDFDMAGNIPNERAYKNARHFRYDQPMEAAKFIYAFLNNE